MKKILTVFCLLGSFTAPAQTLFTYGRQTVSADEFLRAFQKAATGPRDEKAAREYLDLYIASRLKVAEAKEQKLDTLSQLKLDLANLRQQILPTYIVDKQSLDNLVKEAFARSQKDLRAAHIFIAFTKNGLTDTVAAAAKRDQAVTALAKGQAFEQVAKQYSDDPSATTNGGDLGWITTFTLPYELESAIYNTPVGKTSPVVTTKAGYHIFKTLAERKAMGRMKAAQILLAFPPGADDAYKARLQKKADSLYNRLLAGDEFGKLATTFSNDVVSAASNGQMQAFGIGEYNPAFEAAVFALPKDGAISKPFLTEHGYHLVKRLSLEPIAAKLDEETAADLLSRIQNSDRVQVARSVLAKRVLQQAGYNTLVPSAQLWVYTDSVLNYAKPGTAAFINGTSPVLKMAGRMATAAEWTNFAQTHRFRANGAAKTYPVLWDEFLEATALQYYEDHLEDYNEDFRRQITEFADGNLFFEIMQRRVWTPAQGDTAALLAYYRQHKASYRWKPSASAVIFYANNADVATDFYKDLQKKPAAWKAVVANYTETVTTDSGRFELDQLPKTAKDKIVPGRLTSPVVNKADNTASFAYILRLHPAPEPRNFADAKGLVINDYQTELEKAWLAKLKKKYPVTVDENVWNTVVRKRL